MAKKIWDGPIYKQTDWGGDLTTNNLPVSGKRVQEYIKNSLEAKYGFSRVVGNLLQFFSDEDSASLFDEDNETYASLLLKQIELPEGGGSGSGFQYYLRIINNLDSRNLVISKGDSCVIDFKFISQSRESSDDEFEDTGERGYVQLYSKSGDSGYKLEQEFYIDSNIDNKIDVTRLLVSGNNSIMIKVTGEESGETAPTLVYNVQITTLSLNAKNFRWYNVFTENIVIPLQIGGNISKQLNVEITGEDYSEYYTVNLGTNIYTETAYNYILKHPNKTGVFNVSISVQNLTGTLKTSPISFNIICIVEGATEKLIAINNVLDKATNWSENCLYEYTMYDGLNVYTTVNFSIVKDGEEIFESRNSSIITSSKQSLIVPLEVETIDNTDFEIAVNASDDLGDICSHVFTVDNKLGFSAISGALLYINPKTRSNSQVNAQLLINEMDGSLVTAKWENMSWGNDGWSVDNDGNKVLRLIAGSSVNIGYKPFAIESARIGKTIEFDYAVNNISDYSKEIISISSSDEKFTGIKIYPDDSLIYSQSLKNKDTQSINIKDGERIKISFVIMPNAYGNSGFNLCIIYVNGVKNREFTYENNDYFYQEGNIIIGSEFADVDIYGIRIYNSALTSGGVFRNLINWTVGNDERTKKTQKNDVLDSNGSDIDYNKVKKLYNVFVLNSPIPSLSNPNKMTGPLEVFWNEHPEWNSYIDLVECDGQGTSSKKYWKWNLRWKLSGTSIVSYEDGNENTIGKWKFIPSMPLIKRATAKKNFASPMHSHKMGSVNSMSDLANAMGIINEANARISVYQYPFVGFEKSINDEGQEIYTFIGLYTFGPDKGDANTFGYDEEKYPNLISIEGSDNAPLCTLFRVPWNPSAGRIKYNSDEEAFQYNNTNSWDLNAGSESNISLWIPAYNFTYECSPRLKPFEGTIDQLNSLIEQYKNEPYEYWVTGGDVCYYEVSEGKFIHSNTGNGNINLFTQLVDKGYGLSSSDTKNKSIEELNTLFINARIQKFRLEMEQYFDLNDAIFQRNWVEFNAATDNRAKNTYPYNFGTSTSKWRWRGDDMDTIWPITNQGESKKGYWVEIGDKYDNNQPVWNGETSNFWNLLDLAFPEEIISQMRFMMSKMEELGGLSTGSSLDRMYAYFKKYYFDMAQEYFCETLYNADTQWTHENSKLAYIKGDYTNDTDPMTQALGDHYSAEKRWIVNRIVYMMSKYSYGLFSANGSDSITVRAAGNSINYQLTPAIDLYPAIANGTSIIRGERTKAGEVCEMTIELSGSGDQQNVIQGASYLQDVGNWYDKNVTGSMIVQGKMLRDLRLGSKTEDIVISISSLTISNCFSLQKLTLSNISTLTGSLDLSTCAHLNEIYADGTGLSQIILPNGGNLMLIEYGSENQYINLQNFSRLTNDGVIIDNCITKVSDFFVDNCDKMNPIELLYSIYTTQKEEGVSTLKRIRCTNFDVSAPDEVIDMLYNMAQGDYNGLDATGIATTGLPILEGTIYVENATSTAVNRLLSYYPQLTINYNNNTSPTGYNLSILNDMVIPETDEAIQMNALSSNSNYPEVLWSIYNYGDYTPEILSIDQNSGVITIKSNKNDNTVSGYKTFTLRATSFYNDRIVVNKEFLVNAVSISQISISGDEILSSGEVSQMEISYSPSDYTKVNDVVWETNKDNIIEIEDDGKITVIYNKTDCVLLTLTAKLKIDETKQDSMDIVINDFNIITSESNPVAMDGCYLKGYSSSSSFMKFSEAIKIKTLVETFVSRHDLTSFDELQHFVNLEGIGYMTFYDCQSLQSVIAPSSVITIGTYAFYKCTSLESIDLPNVIIAGQHCFDGCTNLKSINMSKLMYVMDCFFRACKSLEYIDLPNVLSIHEDAFRGCISLKTITLGSELRSIGDGAFYECESLEYIDLPESLEVIGSWTFIRCKKLTSITIPSKIKIIKEYTFCECDSVKSVSMHNNVENIGENAFEQLQSLVSINLSTNLSIIQTGAFAFCRALPSIVIPEKCTTIESRAFYDCRKLESFTLKSSTPPTIAEDTFNYTPCNFYVPVGSLSAYKSAEYWSDMADRIFETEV